MVPSGSRQIREVFGPTRTQVNLLGTAGTFGGSTVSKASLGGDCPHVSAQRNSNISEN